MENDEIEEIEISVNKIIDSIPNGNVYSIDLINRAVLKGLLLMYFKGIKKDY